MLIFVHHCAVGICNIDDDFTLGINIVNTGICIDIKAGHSVRSKIRCSEEARNIAVAGGPAVVNVVIQNVQPAVALASVCVIAEGGLHQCKLRIELIRTNLGKALVDFIKGIDVCRR